MNSYGHNIRLTTFGESHGPATGGVLDGFPAGIRLDFDAIQKAIEQRRPGRNPLMTQRNETDCPEWLSGIHPSGVTLGTPIAWIVRNSDTRPHDYSDIENLYRPGHADFTWQAKYGIRDVRGGGRASARETLSRVIGAAIAAQLPEMEGILVNVTLESVGDADGDSEAMREEIMRARADNDSVGATVRGIVTGLKAGIGDPVFGKLSSRLAEAVMSIPAVRGFELGLGMASARMRGSQSNDIFTLSEDGKIITSTNNCGGIQGGISNGMPIEFRVAFHATPTISIPQPTVDTAGAPAIISARGRHDPCVGVRGLAVVKAMTILAIADMLRSPDASVINCSHNK